MLKGGWGFGCVGVFDVREFVVTRICIELGDVGGMRIVGFVCMEGESEPFWMTK